MESFRFLPKSWSFLRLNRDQLPLTYTKCACGEVAAPQQAAAIHVGVPVRARSERSRVSEVSHKGEIGAALVKNVAACSCHTWREAQQVESWISL